jgi:hypothetical protein
MTGKFKREFANEAVVNDHDYLWDRPPFAAPLAYPTNEKGGSRRPPSYDH